MASLKDDGASLASVKGILSSIVSELSEVDSFKAKQLCEWFLEKSQYFRKHVSKDRFQRLPNNMKRGMFITGLLVVEKC